MVIGDLGHFKYLDENSKSNQVFGTNTYSAPEAYNRMRRSNKIDIWSFGCIVYELFNLEKLFNLQKSIGDFQVESDLKSDKMKPLYVTVVKR